MNRLQDQRFIGDGQCVRSKNLVPTRSGMAAKRGAVDYLQTLVLESGTHCPASIVLPPDTFGGGYWVSYRNQTAATKRTQVRLYGGTTSVTIDWTEACPIRPLFLNYNRKTYIFAGPGSVITGASGTTTGATNPVGRYGIILEAFPPGSGAILANGFNWYTTTAETTTTEPDAVPLVACTYRDRTFWGNFGTGYEDIAVLSDPKLPRVVGANFLAANGRNFRVGARDGDRIVAAREIMLTAVGSPSQSALLVLREYSAYLFTGEPNLVASGAFVLGDFTQSRINVDCGCASADTLVNTPYGLLWAGWDDVWLFPEGHGVPYRVGSNIRSVLGNTPPSARYLWHASYFDGFYRLQVFSAGAGPVHNTPCDEEWRLDLRNGPPRDHTEARWYGPMVYNAPTQSSTPVPGVLHTVADTRLGVTPRLVGLHTVENLYGVIGQFEVDNVRDFASFPTTALLGANSYLQGTEILIDWQGKEDDLGDAQTEKGYSGTEVNYKTGSAGQLKVEDSLDGGRAFETISESLPNVGFELNVDVLGTDALYDEAQSVRMDASQSTRANGKTHQIRIYDVAGYVISDLNNTVKITIVGGSGIAAGTYTVTLTNGLYDTKTTLLDHFVTQLVAATASGWSHNQSGTGLDNMVTLTHTTATFQINVSTTVSKRFWGMLGYNTETPAAAATSQAAVLYIFLRDAMSLEIAGANALFYPIRRRAT